MNIESLHSSMNEFFDKNAKEHESFQEKLRVLYATAVQDGENIRALARIAEVHERRLTEIEGSADVQ